MEMMLLRRKLFRGKRLYLVFLLAASVGLFFTFRTAKTVDSGHISRLKLRLAEDRGFGYQTPLHQVSLSTRHSTLKRDKSAGKITKRLNAGRDAPEHPELFGDITAIQNAGRRKHTANRTFDSKTKQRLKDVAANASYAITAEKPSAAADNTGSLLKMSSGKTVNNKSADPMWKQSPERDSERPIPATSDKDATEKDSEHPIPATSDKDATEKDSEQPIPATSDKDATEKDSERPVAATSDKDTTEKDNSRPIPATSDRNTTEKDTTEKDSERPVPATSDENTTEEDTTEKDSERLVAVTSDKDTTEKDNSRPIRATSDKNATENDTTEKDSERPVPATSDENTTEKDTTEKDSERPVAATSDKDTTEKDNSRPIRATSDKNATEKDTTEKDSERLVEATSDKNTTEKDTTEKDRERPVPDTSDTNTTSSNNTIAKEKERPVNFVSDKTAAGEGSERPVTASPKGLPESTLDKAAYEQVKRTNHLRKVCEKYRNTSAEIIRAFNASVAWTNREIEKNFFADQGHHMVYCAVEKVSSSFWKRAFRILNNKSPKGSLFSQSGLSSHVINQDLTFIGRSALWKRDMLQTSLKFIFVRHPFGRTFSAYMDKIFLPYDVHLHEDTEMSEKSSWGHEQTRQRKGQCRVAIPSFAKFIGNSFSLGTQQNELFDREPHFSPVHTHCKPCSANFDVIGKLESFHVDTEYILSKAGLALGDLVGADQVNGGSSGDPAGTFDVRSDLNIMTDMVVRTLTSPAWIKLGEAGCWAMQDEILRRLWTVFKVRGLLSAHQPYPFSGKASPQWLEGSNATTAVIPALLQAVNAAYFNASLPNASDGTSRSSDNISSTAANIRSSSLHQQRMWQRDAAVAEAFRSVDPHGLAKLAAFHKADCELFDYDCSPEVFLHHHSAPANNSFFREWL